MFTENDAFLYGEKYRTAALEAGYNNGHGTTLTAGLKLFTGKPDIASIKPYPGANEGAYYNDSATKYSAGIFYGGIRINGQDFQLGGNSDYFRHGVQNVIVHNNISGSPWFLYNHDKRDSFYFNYSSYSPYTFY